MTKGTKKYDFCFKWYFCTPQDVWETPVPAPTNKDTELKYVDLDHDEDKEPVRSPHAVSSALTPTEYHEIDFVKTTVLQNLKEQRNKKSTDTT